MTYKYLASAYTDTDPLVMQRRFEAAEHCLNWLLRHRIWTYSPIVHCHQMAVKYGLPKDHRFWQEYDQTMIVGSNGVLVLNDPEEAWIKSSGVQDEIQFTRGRKMLILTATPDGGGYTFHPLGELSNAL